MSETRVQTMIEAREQLDELRMNQVKQGETSDALRATTDALFTDLKKMIAELRPRGFDPHKQPMIQSPSTSTIYTANHHSPLTPKTPSPPPDPPDFNQFGQRLSKFEFPKFDGTLLRDWFRRCDEYFYFHRTPPEMRVRVVSPHMIGKALQWHTNYIRNNFGIFPPWLDYIIAISAKFGDDDALPLARAPFSPYQIPNDQSHYKSSNTTSLLPPPETTKTLPYKPNFPTETNVEKFSYAEMQERRTEGLCMSSDESYTHGHHVEHKNAEVFVTKFDDEEYSIDKESGVVIVEETVMVKSPSISDNALSEPTFNSKELDCGLVLEMDMMPQRSTSKSIVIDTLFKEKICLSLKTELMLINGSLPRPPEPNESISVQKMELMQANETIKKTDSGQAFEFQDTVVSNMPPDFVIQLQQIGSSIFQTQQTNFHVWHRWRNKAENVHAVSEFKPREIVCDAENKRLMDIEDGINKADVNFYLKHKWRSTFLQSFSGLKFCVDNIVIITSLIKAAYSVLMIAELQDTDQLHDMGGRNIKCKMRMRQISGDMVQFIFGDKKAQMRLKVKCTRLRKMRQSHRSWLLSKVRKMEVLRRIKQLKGSRKRKLSKNWWFKYKLVYSVWRQQSDKFVYGAVRWAKFKHVLRNGSSETVETTKVKQNLENYQSISLLELLKRHEARVDMVMDPYNSTRVVKFTMEQSEKPLVTILSYGILHSPRPPELSCCKEDEESLVIGTEILRTSNPVKRNGKSFVMMLFTIAGSLILLSDLHILVSTKGTEVSIKCRYEPHSGLDFTANVTFGFGTFMEEFSSVCKFLLGAFVLNLIDEHSQDSSFFGLISQWKDHPPDHFSKVFNGSYSSLRTRMF